MKREYLGKFHERHLRRQVLPGNNTQRQAAQGDCPVVISNHTLPLHRNGQMPLPEKGFKSTD